MKIFPPAPALLAFLAAAHASGCASSPWQSTESVPGGTLYVPKVYAPLIPGSIYPDRKVPVPAKGRPAVILVCPEKSDCRENVILDQAAQRGLVVLIGREPRGDLLRTRAEADPERVGWLLVAPTGDSLRGWAGAGAPVRATAILLPPRAPGAPASAIPASPSRRILLAALLSEEAPEAGDGTVLKLYSPNSRNLLPDEAFRDAVEWLAGALASP